jgi:hypothetical protein
VPLAEGAITAAEKIDFAGLSGAAAKLRATPEGSRVAAAIVPALEETTQHSIKPFVRKAGGEALNVAANAFDKTSALTQEPVNTAFGLSFFGGAGAGALAWVANLVRLKKVSGVLSEASSLAHTPVQWMQETQMRDAGNVLSSAMQRVGQSANNVGLKDAAEFLSTHSGNVASVETNVTSKAAGAVEGLTATIGGRLSGKVGSTITALPAAVGNTIGNKSVMLAAHQGAAGLAAVGQDLHTLHTFRTKLDQMGSLYADLTGVDPDSVSPIKLLLMKGENLPALVRAERDALVGCIAPATLMSLISNVVGMKMATFFGNQTNMNANMQGVFAMMGLQMASSTVMGATMPRNPVSEAYNVVKEVYESTGAIPTDFCAAFLATASPTLCNVGAENAYTKALAESYTAQHLSPTDLARKVETGAVAADLSRITDQINAKKATAALPAAKVAAMEPKGRIAEPQLAAGVA